MTESEMKKEFADWLRYIAQKEGGGYYTKNSVREYTWELTLERNDRTTYSAVRECIRKLNGGKNFYSIQSIEDYRQIADEITKIINKLIAKNKKNGVPFFTSSNCRRIFTHINKYKEFLEYKAITASFTAWLAKKFSDKKTRNRYFNELLLNTTERKSIFRLADYAHMEETIKARNVYIGIQTIEEYEKIEWEIEQILKHIEEMKAGTFILSSAMHSYKQFLGEREQNSVEIRQKLNSPDTLPEEISVESAAKLSGDEEKMQDEFKEWLGDIARQPDGSPYKEDTVEDYAYRLALTKNNGTFFSQISDVIRKQTGGENFYSIQTIEEYRPIENKIQTIAEKLDREDNNSAINKKIKKYKEFLEYKEISELTFFPDEVSEKEATKFPEGGKKQITVNAYERKSANRKKCIEEYGSYKCQVCDFDFKEKYGVLGKEYIHVHHKIPLSERREIHKPDPKEDLIPVCPNCHAMLHRKTPALSIDELKEIIEKHRRD